MSEIKMKIHSTTVLIKASLIATLIAAMLFITVILPAEFNIDPLGSGKFLGLTILAEAAENPIKAPSKNPPLKDARTDEVTITVAAGRGLEYKFQMKKHAKLKYEWQSGSTEIYFDFHGEPEGGGANSYKKGYFESYALSAAKSAKGTVTVPFDGVHGWYWKNNSDQDTLITLKTSGIYTVIGNPKKP
jgi:D-alanyl-D-alanine carboxypeptidase